MSVWECWGSFKGLGRIAYLTAPHDAELCIHCPQCPDTQLLEFMAGSISLHIDGALRVSGCSAGTSANTVQEEIAQILLVNAHL